MDFVRKSATEIIKQKIYEHLMRRIFFDIQSFKTTAKSRKFSNLLCLKTLQWAESSIGLRLIPEKTNENI
jgi:hypothetical protein